MTTYFLNALTAEEHAAILAHAAFSTEELTTLQRRACECGNKVAAIIRGFKGYYLSGPVGGAFDITGRCPRCSRVDFEPVDPWPVIGYSGSAGTTSSHKQHHASAYSSGPTNTTHQSAQSKPQTKSERYRWGHTPSSSNQAKNKFTANELSNCKLAVGREVAAANKLNGIPWAQAEALLRRGWTARKNKWNDNQLLSFDAARGIFIIWQGNQAHAGRKTLGDKVKKSTWDMAFLPPHVESAII
jgi:hypothetical protein